MEVNKQPANADASDQPTFEEALKRLGEIVHLLEEGDLGLNQALERYEEGVKLLRQSYELLNRAERRIELLSGIDAEGNPVTQPFDDTATFKAGQSSNAAGDPTESAKRRSRRRTAQNHLPGLGGSDPHSGDVGIDGP